MNKYLVLVFILLSSVCRAEDIGVDYRCFVSPNGKIKMRMMWASTVDWVGGYVQYGKNKDKITIVQVNYEEETNDEGRPYAVNSDWVEIIDGKVNGRYHFGYQGANFDNVFYINAKGKRFDFSQALENYEDCF
ncbi:hypothetical protein UXA55_12475 [Aeromonas caviae]|jgi:hypothetical protein|uniref:hypothetical protein n=1 Tax=Aeromonas TaxID=642 RepID=UPI00290AE4D6|nr:MULTISPECIES: hypothetical protein [Aeromonas]MDU7580880.1 hypothetical protein [Aeromonas sp.]MDY7830412.1 hypothetical protein [Aeromonas caviae]